MLSRNRNLVRTSPRVHSHHLHSHIGASLSHGRMRSRKPVCAGVKNRQTLDCLSNSDADDGLQVEQVLLQKIGLLAAQHARNVEALYILRGITPREAWADYGNLAPLNEAKSVYQLNRSRSPNDSPRARSAYKVRRGSTTPKRTFDGHRCFTNVTALTARSWKGEPTVVEPFRSMETHTMAWKRRIRQQEEHDLQMKLEEQNARDKDRERFIAGMKEGTPFSGIIHRSNKMIERRRDMIIEAETREETKRKACMFKARPVHITDKDWRTIQEKQDTSREQRRKRRQEEVLSKSSLPRRMAMHAINKKAADTSGTGDKRPSGVEARSTSGKKTIPPDKIAEVLARRRRLWDERLATSRLKKKPLVPQVLPMEEREKTYKIRAHERTRREKDKLDAARRLEEDEKQRKREKAFAAPVPVAPRTTHSFLLKTAQVQARLDQARDEAKREEQRRQHSRTREQETGRMLMEAMGEIDRQQGRRSRRDIDEEVKLKMREDSRKFHKALRENKARLEQATFDRLSLWERHDAAVRKREAKRVALTAIAEKVFQAGSVGGHWKRGSAVDRIFDEEEKVALGMGSF